MHFLVLQHLDCEHPGVFRDFWRKAGHDWQAVELDEGEAFPEDVSSFDALLVMGGPMDVWQEDEHPWLVPEKAFIRDWVTRLKRPYLGICLGHQLLAASLGGQVGLMKRPEIGIESVDLTEAGRGDRLFAGLARRFDYLQWHGAEVSALPEGGTTLAASPACPIQAMRWGDHAYGLQFHVELTEGTVTDWNEIPEYRAALETTLGDGGCDRLTAAARAHIEKSNAAAEIINDNFMAIVQAT
ncbi:MAG: GMP synthase [Rhodospirillaceae bacterium]|nr:GMP synthase [Rhodospirillaceae bacterium]